MSADPMHLSRSRLDVDRLAQVSEELGETRAITRLEALGTIHCLAPDVPEAELVRALSAAGLCISSVGGVQLIHRMPLRAA
jgi:hypothetical protein